MWSAGRKRARLYLGGHLALLQLPGQALISLAHSPTLPQAAVLQQLAQLAIERGQSLRRLKMDVDLGASLCRGAVLSASPSKRLASELSAGLQQELARQLPWPVQQCLLPSGTLHGSVCPVTTQALMRTLMAWAQSQQADLGVVQGLWTLVTQSQRAQAEQIQAIALLEPDGLVLYQTEGTALGASQTAAWHWEPAQNTNSSVQTIELALQQYRFNAQATAKFRFTVQANAGHELGLSAWAGHWSQA